MTDGADRAARPPRAPAKPGAGLLHDVAGLIAGDLDLAPERIHLEVSAIRARGASRFLSLVAVHEQRRIEVLVKQLVGSPEALTARNRVGRRGELRPRLAGTGSQAERYRLEHAWLVAVEQELARVPDARLDSVHAFGYLPEHGALVMERHPGHRLRDLVAGATLRRLRPAPALRARAMEATRRAGAWLRRFHALPGAHLPARHATRAEVESWIDAACPFLGENLGDRATFEGLRRSLSDAARRSLPDAQPMAPSHGDFAPRNVLVGTDGRLAGLDIAGATQAPIVEDLAYFGTSVRSPATRVFTLGALHDPGAIAELEAALVDGYGGPAATALPAIRLYQALLVLDRWWGTPPRLPASLRGRLALAVGAPVADRYLRGELDELLASI